MIRWGCLYRLGISLGFKGVFGSCIEMGDRDRVRGGVGSSIGVKDKDGVCVLVWLCVGVLMLVL